MYDIYLKNYYWNGSLIKDEIHLYSIPIIESDKDNVLTDPSVSCDVGKTGSFEFTIYPNHPYYHAIAQMRTIMRVEYDGDTIFRGRILTIDNTMTGVKKVHCEGDMAFLLDSFQMGSKEANRPSVSLNTYITNILNEHNRQMGESGETDKYIYPGYIPGNYPNTFSSDQQIENKSEKFGSNSHEQSMNALEELSKEFGGFFRTRYDSSTKCTYLDWVRNWFREDSDDSQPIAITQNIIDAQSNSEVDNIFTALIPVGKKEGEDIFITGYKTEIHGNNNRILVPQITQVFTTEQLKSGYMTKELYEKATEQYGIIYKVQNFSNADTPEKLWEYSCDWIKNNYVGGITNYDLTAVDMHHVNGSIRKYLLGDRIKLELPSDMTELDEYAHDRSTIINRTLLSCKYNLHNPDKNSYMAGISSDILNREYGTASTSKSKGGGGGGAGAKGGGSGNNQKKIGGDSALTEQTLDSLAYRHIISSEYNNDLYKKLLADDPTGQSAAAAEKASQVQLVRDIRGTEVLEDGSSEERTYGMATSMVLDATKASLDVFVPVVKFLGFDEFGKKLTEIQTAKSLEIDGYNRYLSVKGLPDYHEDFDPMLNIIGKGVEVIGTATDYLLDPLDVFGLRSKEKGAFMSFLGGTKEDNKKTVTLNGEDGIVGEIMNILGSDGSADIDLATILQDGLGNDGKGTLNIGKLADQWLIQMNQPLTYVDENNVLHTIPDGIIDAKDYATLTSGIKKIPSFTTQLGVFDTLIARNASLIELKADKADFNTLSSKVADIDKITSGLVKTDRLSADRMVCDNLDVSNTVRLSGMVWGNNNRISLVPFSSLGAATRVLAVSSS